MAASGLAGDGFRNQDAGSFSFPWQGDEDARIGAGSYRGQASRRQGTHVRTDEQKIHVGMARWCCCWLRLIDPSSSASGGTCFTLHQRAEGFRAFTLLQRRQEGRCRRQLEDGWGERKPHSPGRAATNGRHAEQGEAGRRDGCGRGRGRGSAVTSFMRFVTPAGRCGRERQRLVNVHVVAGYRRRLPPGPRFRFGRARFCPRLFPSPNKALTLDKS